MSERLSLACGMQPIRERTEGGRGLDRVAARECDEAEDSLMTGRDPVVVRHEVKSGPGRHLGRRKVAPEGVDPRPRRQRHAPVLCRRPRLDRKGQGLIRVPIGRGPVAEPELGHRQVGGLDRDRAFNPALKVSLQVPHLTDVGPPEVVKVHPPLPDQRVGTQALHSLIAIGTSTRLLVQQRDRRLDRLPIDRDPGGEPKRRPLEIGTREKVGIRFDGRCAELGDRSLGLGDRARDACDVGFDGDP